MISRILSTGLLVGLSALGVGAPALFAAPSLPVPIQGRVVDPAGTPVAEARVSLFPIASQFTTGRLEIEGETGPEPVSGISTDGAGAFLLSAPRPGMWRVVIEARGFVPLEQPLVPLTDAAELPEARLLRDVGLTVRVQGADEEPLPGCRVRVEDGSPPDLRNLWRRTWRIPPRTGRTNRDGTVLLPRAEGETVRARAGCENRFPAGVEGIRSASARIRLTEARSRILEVRDALGRPASGVLVRVGEELWPVGMTSAPGRISIPSPGGRSSQPVIFLQAADGRSLLFRLGPPRPGEDGKPQVVRLPPPGSLDGRVVSSLDGRQVAGALVWAGQDAGLFRETGADGSFRLPAPSVGESWVAAGAPGFFQEEIRITVPPSGSLRTPTLSLVPRLAASGIVVDAAGRPLPGAEVKALFHPATRGRNLRVRRSGAETRSARDGRFRIGNLLPGVAYEVRLAKPGFAPVRVDLPASEPGRPFPELRVVLRPGRTGFGRVLGADRRPISGARVTLRPVVSGDLLVRLTESNPERSLSFNASTDPQGRFEVPDLPAGSFDLTVTARGQASLTVPGLAVPEGRSPVDLGTVVLAAGVALRGFVVDPAGRPVEGAEVRIREEGTLGEDSGEPLALSAPDGFFMLEDRRAGETVDIVAARAGFAEGSLTGIRVPPEEPVRVVLRPTANVSGRVVDPSGHAIAGARVALDELPTERAGASTMSLTNVHVKRTITDEEGGFSFAAVSPGIINLQAAAPGRRNGGLEGVEVRTGEDLAGIEIVLPAGATISGEVLSPSGKPAPGATVTVPSQQLGGGLQALTDGDGRYRLDGVAPGPRVLTAHHELYGRVTRDLDIPEGESTLDFHFTGGHEVSGRVEDEGGTPIPGARLTLRPNEGGWSAALQAASGPDGTFSFAGVPDGSFRLTARKEGYAGNGQGETVTVSGAPVPGLDVRLGRGGTITGRIIGLAFQDLAGVRVTAGPETHLGRVEPEGTYRIDHLEPGPWGVVATAPGGRHAEGSVTLEAGAAEARLDLDLGGGFTLTGRVLQGGQPAPGLVVVLNGQAAATRRSDTDGAGSFAFAGLDAGRYTLEVFGALGDLRHRQNLDLEAGRDLRIELKTGRIAGRVLDAASASPLAGALVALLAQDGNPGFAPKTVTDSRGEFVLRDVGEGAWTVRATLDGYAPAEVEVRVDGEAPVEDLKLDLRPAEGLVLEAFLASGHSPAQLRIAVFDPAGRLLETGTFPTTETGRARVSSVPAGSWDVVVGTSETGPVEISTSVPGPPVRLLLPSPGELRVRAPELEASGLAANLSLFDAQGRLVRIFDAGGGLRSWWPLERGMIFFGRLSPGTYKVVLQAQDRRTWNRTVTIVSGSVAELILE